MWCNEWAKKQYSTYRRSRRSLYTLFSLWTSSSLNTAETGNIQCASLHQIQVKWATDSFFLVQTILKYTHRRTLSSFDTLRTLEKIWGFSLMMVTIFNVGPLSWICMVLNNMWVTESRGKRKWDEIKQHSQADQEDQQGRGVQCRQTFPEVKDMRTVFIYYDLNPCEQWRLSRFSQLHDGRTVSPFGPDVPWGPGRPLSPFSPCSPGGPMRPIRPGCPFSPLAPGSPRRPGKPGGPCRRRRRKEKETRVKKNKMRREMMDEMEKLEEKTSVWSKWTKQLILLFIKVQSRCIYEDKTTLLSYQRSRRSFLSRRSWRSLLTLKQSL